MNDTSYSELLTDRELDVLRLKVKRHTNQEIGNMLHLAKNTVRWYVSQIYSKLHVDNRRELKAYAEKHGLLQETPTLQPTIKDNLPTPITSFVGREREIGEICQRISTTRLLTLSGTGGTGKTRLALQAIKTLGDMFPHGIYFVNLAPLTDPHMVARAIADVFKIMQSDDEPIENTLKRVLKSKNCLMILDNFEHVIVAAPLVSDLVRHTDNLHILVTSREALQIYGEHVYTVDPLPLVDVAHRDSLPELSQNDAIQLFVQRAQAISRHFQLTTANAQSVAEICERLDGLPLAIELAAAQITMLNPHAILHRMESRLDTLKGRKRDRPQRHKTIRDTIAWSYDLLDEDEKTLFARLSVFRGGRSLEAVESVCQDELRMDVFDGLISLVNKSLIRQYEDSLGEPRFWMLETIHEFAADCLEANGESESFRLRHATYFCQIAQQAEPELLKSDQTLWTQRLEIEHDNIRVALRWSFDGGCGSLGVQIVNAMHWFWVYGVYQRECDYWAQQAREHFDEVSQDQQIQLLNTLGNMEWFIRQDFLKKWQLIKQAVTMARQFGNKRLLARTLLDTSASILGRPDDLAAEITLDETMAYCQEALDLFQDLDDLSGQAWTLNILAVIQDMKGEKDVAWESYERCIAIARQAGDVRRIFIVLINLASIAREMGKHEQATRLARESLRMRREANDTWRMISALHVIFDPVSQAQQATRLLAASDVALKSIGAILMPSVMRYYKKVLVLARENLSEEDFEKAWNEGSSMTLSEAVAYALDEV